jgi:EmrB/QacA subfamily drug resistance transporter
MASLKDGAETGQMTGPASRGQQPASAMPVGGTQLLVTVSGLLLGMLLAALDQTIVSTAMPTIFRELGGNLSNYSWVFTAYLLTSTVTVPIYGKLSDLWGRKWFFMGGIVMFLIGSALSGASQSITQLIIFRAVQGIGAGAIMPIAFAIIGDIFPPAERGKWQGLFSGVFGLASIVGPALGGFITDNFSWRWIFYINLPLGAAALVVLFFTLPVFRNPRASRIIDYLGTVLLLIGVTPLLLGFSLAGDGPGQYAWDSWQIITCFAVAGAGTLAFIFWELFGAREPVLDLRLFKNGIFTISNLATVMMGAAMFGTILYIPLFLQYIVGVTATNSGSLLTPLMMGWVVASIISGQLLSRWGRYKILAIVGVVLTVVGMFLMSRVAVTTGQGSVVANMIILGLGMGTVIALFTIVVQNAFPIYKIGVVTAALTFFRQIASTVGTAVFGALLSNQFNNTFPGQLKAAFPGSTPQSTLDNLQQHFANYNLLGLPTDQVQQIHDGIAKQIVAQLLQQQVPPAAANQQASQIATDTLHHLFDALKGALVSGIQEVFFVAFIMLCVALVTVLFLKEIPLRKQGGASGLASMAEGGAEATAAAQERPSAINLIERELEGFAQVDDENQSVPALEGSSEEESTLAGKGASPGGD